jgi:hypothetical protein
MALNGKFFADFEDFYTAVDTAEVKLRDFETGAGRVGSTLDKMADRFSGRQVISEATLMAEAVERIGGASRLTEGELARVGAVAQEAASKMRALGMEVPAQLDGLAASAKRVRPPLDDVNEAATKSGNAFRSLDTGLSTVDKTLNAFGINLGPTLGAVRELGDLSDVAGSKMSNLSKAVAVAGAAFAGWEIGRTISGFFDLDKKIGDSVAAMMGWGDVAKEEAAAGADALARASQIAGREVTNMKDAIAITTQHTKDLADAQKEAADKQEAAMDKIRATVERYKAAVLSVERGLIGKDDIEQADHYLVALRSLHEQGQVPLKDKWDEIVAVMEAARVAHENLGQTGTRMYRELIRTIDEFTPKLLEATHLSARLLMGATPDTSDMGSQGQTGNVQAEIEWWKNLEQGIADMDAEIRKYYEVQGVVFEEGAQGAADTAEAVRGIGRAADEAARSMGGLIDLGLPKGANAADVSRAWELARASGGALSFEQAFGTVSGRGVGITGGGGYTLNIDARESFYDTPDSLQRLADKVGSAVLNRIGR